MDRLSALHALIDEFGVEGILKELEIICQNNGSTAAANHPKLRSPEFCYWYDMWKAIHEAIQISEKYDIA
jgi:hypothetical protein